jgi:hypothetical protein
MPSEAEAGGPCSLEIGDQMRLCQLPAEDAIAVTRRTHIQHVSGGSID